MKSGNKKLGAALLRYDLALLLLNDADPKGVFKKAAHDATQAIIRKYDPEEYKHILICKNVINKLAEKLVACASQEELFRTLAYMEALNTGNVYIAADGQEIITE
jgi:hypothetical protein